MDLQYFKVQPLQCGKNITPREGPTSRRLLDLKARLELNSNQNKKQ